MKDPIQNNSLKLYTSTEVAEVLRMNPQVITRKLQAGEIPGYKIGKDWRVSEQHLLQFLETLSNQRVKNPGQAVLDAFFQDGKLKSIPATRSKRLVVLRHLVSKLDAGKVYQESEINEFLKNVHSDYCTLRREFIMNKLMVRKNGKYKVIAPAP